MLVKAFPSLHKLSITGKTTYGHDLYSIKPSDISGKLIAYGLKIRHFGDRVGSPVRLSGD